MLENHTNYRTYLKAKLAERVTCNPAYSLRAMARQVGLAPSLLCEVMKGSRPLTSKSALKLSNHFQMSEREADYFHLLVQFENETSEELRALITNKIKILKPQAEIKDLSIDAFKSIAEWFHIPILELTQIPHFQFTSKNIAATLGISEIEATVAIERLERLELLEKNLQGKYQKVNSRFIANATISNSAFKHFNKSFLDKAALALDTQSPEERFSGSETFAFSPENLSEAKQISEEFFNRMVALADKDSNPNEIYHLNVQFFRVTQSSKKRENANDKN